MAAILIVATASTAPAQTAADLEKYDLSFSKGLILYSKGQYQNALELFAKALAAKPGDPDAGYYLGQTLIRVKRYSDAETVFQNLHKAEPASGRVLLGLAIAQFHRRKFQTALDTLLAAQPLIQEDPLLHYYLGLAYNKLGEFEKSPEPLARAMALSPELATEIRYQRGYAHYRQGLFEQAQQDFEAVTEADPQSELGLSARQFLEEIKKTEAQARKRWNLSFSVSEQYDSNVVLLPGGNQPSSGVPGISRRDDFRTTIQARGEVRPIQTAEWVSGLSYNFYQTFQQELSAFDIQDHNPGLYLQRKFGPLQVRVQYLFDYLLVGPAPFLLSHTAQSILALSEGREAYSQLHLRYQDKDFDPEVFDINRGRDGKNWMVGLTQVFLFAERTGQLRLGYTFDTDRTGGGSPSVAIPGNQTNADWAYTGHRASGGITFPPVFTVKLDLGFDYYRQDYDNPNSFSPTGTTIRRDNIYMFNGSLTKPLTSAISISAQFSYTRDQCNIQIFNYVRNVSGLTLSGSF